MSRKSLVITLLGLFFSTNSFAAAYIKIGDIKGESTDNAHKEWIEILSVSPAPVSCPGTDSDGSACPEPGACEIKITKRMDKTTPLLRQAACNSRSGIDSFFDIFIDVHDNGKGKRASYYGYELTSAKVVDFSVSASSTGGGEPVPVEEVTLNFEKIKVEYKEQGHR